MLILIIIFFALPAYAVIEALQKAYEKNYIRKHAKEFYKDSYTKPQVFDNNRQNINGIYARKSLQTTCEQDFYDKLEFILKRRKNRKLQAQIPLSSIVEKRIDGYAGELFRTIDFGIFDNNGNVIVLIELNDRTHILPERQERDLKVRYILEQANIPLITFWTNSPNDIEYIEEVLKDYI